MQISSWFHGLKGRLLFAATLPVLGFVALFTTAYLGITQTNAIIQKAHLELLPNSFAFAEMRQSRNKFLYQAWASLSDWENSEVKKKRIQQAQEALEEFKESYNQYTKIPFQKGEEAIHDKVKGSMPLFFKSMEDILAVMPSARPEDAQRMRALLGGDFAKIGAEVRDFNRDVNKLYVEISKQELQSAKETEAQVFRTLLVFSSLACLMVFGMLIWIASKISSTVGTLSESLSGAGDQVSQSVTQLNQAGQTLASASAQAAASLEETVAALEELTSMSQRSSDNAKQAASLSKASQETALQGEKEIQELIRSMQVISQSSHKIEEIITVIDDLAFQTNLLALNAAVESARAGEQGKGFAVVAEAVRGLAQKSADAAKDISQLIKTSVQQVDEGSKIADRSGTVLATIVDSVKKVSDLNDEISIASNEQASGIQQINKAMNQLDQAVQSNAASAEEIAATGEEIDSLALTSKKYTVDLNQAVMGKRAA